MAGMASAFQKMGALGQNYAIKQNEMAAAGYNAITDDEHYASAIQKYAQEVSSGRMEHTPANASSFIQNQYLLNKTGGNRDLGGNYGSFGLTNQIDESTSGMQKLALAGVNPNVQTDQGTVLMGTSSALQKEIGRDDLNRPIYEDIVPGSAGDSMLLSEPYTGFSELNLKDRNAARDAARNKKRVADMQFESKGPALLDKLYSSKLRGDDLSVIMQAMVQAKGEGATEDKDGNIVSKDGETVVTAQDMKKAKELLNSAGFKVDDDGTIYTTGNSKTFSFDDGNNSVKTTAVIKEKYNPFTGDITNTFTWSGGGRRYMDVPEELALEWLSGNAGTTTKNNLKQYEVKYKLKGDGKVDPSQDSAVSSALANIAKDGITFGEAKELLGKGSSSAIEKYIKTIKKNNEQLSIDDMAAIAESLRKDQEYTKAYGNEGISALDKFDQQLVNYNNYITRKGGLSEQEKVDRKFNSQKEAVDKFTTNVGGKSKDLALDVIRAANEFEKTPASNIKVETSDNGDITITDSDGPVTYTNEMLLKDEYRKAVESIFDKATNSKWRKK